MDSRPKAGRMAPAMAVFLMTVLAAVLAACSGGAGSDAGGAAAPATFSIGGTVAGLSGTGLQLQNNGGDTLTVTANGAFTFATAVETGTAYAVTVLAQPSGPTQTCEVSGGSGTVAGANVTSVSLTCATTSYTVGGTVAGLSGTGLQLQNNGGDTLTVTANGAFTFTTPVPSGAAYAVTVSVSPTTPNQVCSVSASGSGVIGSGNVSDVLVTCSVNAYTVGGTVSGLSGTLVLRNNGGDDKTITADGSFTFTTPVADTSPYLVTVFTQPVGQFCSIANDSGTLAGANVTNVTVTCQATFTVGGTVSGLSSAGLVLRNNGGDDKPIAADGGFTFATPLADGTPYSVTVLTQPVNQVCTIGGGSGTLAGTNVTNVTVTCGALPLAVLAYPAPFYCGAQLTTDPLVFVFSHSMDTSPVDLSVTAPDFYQENPTQTWSTTFRANDTLTLTPSSSWASGANLLKFTILDFYGGDLPLIVWYRPTLFAPLSMPPFYYVSADTGSDGSDGLTSDAPLASIGAALTAAGSGPAVVLVAAATAPGSEIANTKNAADGNNPYRGYSAGAGTISMLNTVSLCGGFSADFATRDPAANETVIASTATAGGSTFGTLVTPITADATVTPATVLDGFTIVAPGLDTVAGFGGSFTGALTVGGGLQVRNNKLIGGGANSGVIAYVHDNSDPAAQSILTGNYLKGPPTFTGTSYGLYVSEALPVFDNGYIGSNNNYSVFINVPTAAGTVTISTSDIDGGSLDGGTNYAIYVAAGDVDIRNNPEINGGGPVETGTTTGIYFGSGSGTVSNNLITGGSAGTSTGVRISNSAGTVTLTYNNIWGGDSGTGIAVDDAGTDTTVQFTWLNGASSATSAIAIQASGAGLHTYTQNQINGGLSGGSNTGILLDSSTTGVVVRSNLITGCQGYTGSYLQGPCIAIDNDGVGNQFLNNTVNGGGGTQAPKSTAYRQGSAASGSIIQNNLFFTSADGVLDGDGGRCMDVDDSTLVANVSFNDLFYCGGSYYYDQTAATGYTVNDTIPFASPHTLASANNYQDIDPLFVSYGVKPAQLGAPDVDWHLQDISPPEVRSGGNSCTGYDDYGGTEFGFTNEGSLPGGGAMGAYASPTQFDASGC